MKTGIISFAIILLVSAFLGCDTTSKNNTALSNYLPEDTTLVYYVNDNDTVAKQITTTIKDFKANSLLSKNESAIFNTPFVTNPIIEQVETTGESFFAVEKNDSIAPSYIFITKQPKKAIALDSIKEKKVESLRFDKNEVTKITTNNQETFYTITDSILVVSSSLNTIKNVVSQRSYNDNTFQKLVNLPSKNGLSVLKKDKDKNAWTSLHIYQDASSIQGTGILMEADTINPFLSHFKGQIPQPLTITAALPNDIDKATIFTYSDAELLLASLRKYNTDATEVASGIAESFNEISQVEWKGNSFIIAKSIDSQIALESLEPEIEEVKQFRNTIIYKFNSPDYFSENFGSLGIPAVANFMFEFNGYFVFCPSEISAEKISTAIMNDAVISKRTAFKDLETKLTSSVTYCKIAQNSEVPKLLNSYIGETEKNITFKKVTGYDLAIAQYTFENNFAHVNVVTGETSNEVPVVAGVSTPISISIKESVLGNPVFFTTRGNRKKSVAFQDITNTLRGYSSVGKLSWSKKINDPILGDIQEVDIKRNGRKQLAFVTRNKMYVVDENGKGVAPYPISFKDEITQPLAVFDYDNNRKYRFVITQKNEVVMLDSKAKTVKGFTFKKASSEIIATPQHIRLGNKDYLLFQEKRGKLNILSRTGKERIKVNRTFKFNGTAVQRDSKSFVFITSKREQKSISQSGKVTTKKLDVETDYFYEIGAKMKVSLTDNLLRINGKLIELPFGIYTTPNLFYANKTGYVTVTETQENKVYLYKNNGSLVNGFPVYGASSAILTNISKSKSLQLLVYGDAKELLKYQLN